MSTEDVIRTGPGVTGWSKSYDSCFAAANAAGVVSPWVTTEYESAFISKDFASVVAITRRLARIRGDTASACAQDDNKRAQDHDNDTAAAANDDDEDGASPSRAMAATLNLGDPKAAFYLARCIDGGIGECDDDPEEAEQLFRALVPLLTPLAVAGDPSAQFALGECYYNGSGVDEDEVVGKMWYKSAALGGHSEALWAAKAFGLL